MREKKCYKCKIILPLSEFFRDKTKKYGYAGICKKCSIIKGKIYRHNNRKKILKYWSDYRKLNKGKIHKWIKNWKNRDIGRARTVWNKANYKYYHNIKNNRKNKARRHARMVKITSKSCCTMCGSKKRLHRHHPDYNKPLEVVILCRRCHYKEHYN